MTRLILSSVLVCLTATPVFGQGDSPKYELAIGYSYRGTRNPTVSLFGNVFSPGWESANGWALSFTRNLHKNIGVTADLAGQYGNRLGPFLYSLGPGSSTLEIHSFSSHQFLFGPRFFFRAGRVTEYAHTLVGFARTDGGIGTTNFAMGFGGGVQIRLSKRWSVRALQADFIPEKRSDHWQHHVRLQSGIVFNFD